MISYIQPFAPDKNIGLAYNRQVNDCQSEWIAITDMDFCFLIPETKKQIHDIAVKGEFDLYGCMTNRVSLVHQLHNGHFSDDADMRNHTRIAQELHTEKYGIVEPTTFYIAGFFMLFRKSVWERIGGFAEKTHAFDRIFSAQIANKGICQGVYGFHHYRLLSKSPKTDCKHLVFRKV